MKDENNKHDKITNVVNIYVGTLFQTCVPKEGCKKYKKLQHPTLQKTGLSKNGVTGELKVWGAARPG